MQGAHHPGGCGGRPERGSREVPLNPDGKAVLRAARYTSPHEPPSEQYPFLLTTGRTLYHFHTRTETGRVPRLVAAAPDVGVGVSGTDAAVLGLAEGDLAEVASPRGAVRARVRVSAVREGVLFLPFHHGYWDLPGNPDGEAPGRAANEATVTDWDPVSKQPVFKTCSARIRLLERGDGTPAPAPITTCTTWPPTWRAGRRITPAAWPTSPGTAARTWPNRTASPPP